MSSCEFYIVCKGFDILEFCHEYGESGREWVTTAAYKTFWLIFLPLSWETLNFPICADNSTKTMKSAILLSLFSTCLHFWHFITHFGTVWFFWWSFLALLKGLWTNCKDLAKFLQIDFFISKPLSKECLPLANGFARIANHFQSLFKVP